MTSRSHRPTTARLLTLLAILPFSIVQADSSEAEIARANAKLPPQSHRLTSPSGNLVCTLSFTQGASPTYRLDYRGESILRDSPLGIVVDGASLPTGEPTPANPQGTESRARIACRRAASHVDVAYREIRFAFQDPHGRPCTMEVRTYEDGLALRHSITGGTEFAGEVTRFALPTDAQTWWTKPNLAYEGNYLSSAAWEIPRNAQVMPPFAFRTASGKAYAAITEAGLTRFAGMRLRHEGDGVFQPHFQEECPIRLTPEMRMPWRVIMVAANLDGLVNNSMIPSLVDAPADALTNAPWIQPSRLGWSWMAGGGAKGVNLENMKRYSDACAKLGFEGNLVDEGWNHWGDGPEAAWAQVKELVDYGRARNVKTWLWKSCPDRKGIPGLFDPKAREEFFTRCAALGVAGVKLDFINGEDVQRVNFMRETLESAARHKLMVIFHGCNKPTGLEHTWPHEMSREAIRGQEYGPNPELDQQHPFGRLLAGHGDYSPFWIKGPATRAHNLATLVTYQSAVMLPCEHPEKIATLPEVEFFKSVPLTWDATRILPGSEFGQCTAMARRKSGSWFLAVTNGKQAVEKNLLLDFLGAGQWLATTYEDDPKERRATQAQTRRVSASDTVHASMLTFGGYCARFSKIEFDRFGGAVKPGERIRIITSDPAARVTYTLDGTAPGSASAPCPRDGVPITQTSTLRVKIISGDGAGSELANTFNILP